MPYLSWISDEKLSNVVEYVISRMKDAYQRQEPSSSRVTSSSNELLAIFRDEVKFNELSLRKIDRISFSYRRTIGDFHEILFGELNNWEVERPDSEFYSSIIRLIINRTEKKVAVLRGRLIRHIWEQEIGFIQELSLSFEDFQVFVVYDDTNQVKNTVSNAMKKIPLWDESQNNFADNINIITLEQFYSIATKSDNALNELYDVLPVVIQASLAIPYPQQDIPHVFISYTRKNTEEMLTLKQFLDDRGVPNWIDDHLTPVEEDWQ